MYTMGSPPLRLVPLLTARIDRGEPRSRGYNEGSLSRAENGSIHVADTNRVLDEELRADDVYTYCLSHADP